MRAARDVSAAAALLVALAATGCGNAATGTGGATGGAMTGAVTAAGMPLGGDGLPPGHPGMGMGAGAGGTGGAGALPPGHPGMGGGDGTDPHAPGAMGGAGMDMGGGGPPPDLVWTVPEGWVVKPPSSKMRIAEFALPKSGADPEDGTLAVFWFGGSGGGVDANVGRWLGQFTQPDGRATKDVAKIETRTVGAYKVTVVDVSGTFNAEMMPGSGVATTKPGWRMLGAVVEAPEGSYFVKASGPAKTMELWKSAFDAFISSLKPAAI